jgi:hypothetical protein
MGEYPKRLFIILYTLVVEQMIVLQTINEISIPKWSRITPANSS